MTTLSRTFLSLFAVVLLGCLKGASAVTPCHICGSQGNDAMTFPNLILANVEKSCTQIAMEVATDPNVPPGTAQCTKKQNEWKGRCCNLNQRPAGRDPPAGLPPQNVPAVKHVGPHPPCNVCRDGDYPYAISMVINFLYIGEGSCAQYYKYGLEGRIQTMMCDPVKFFSYEPCGCGKFNPYFNPNHPINQQAQQSPGSNGGSSGGGSSSSGGSSASDSPQQQRTPSTQDGNKDCVKLSNDYGGSGACGHSGGRRRGLKGSSSQKSNNKTNKDPNDITVVQQVDVVA